jgi:hypothetical protein
MKGSSIPHISVQHLAKWDSGPASLWISCHGYESRSIAHLDAIKIPASRKLSCGFNFPDVNVDSVVSRRIVGARHRLAEAGFAVRISSDSEFETIVRQELGELDRQGRCRVVVDVSSMSRTRIAALLLAVHSIEWMKSCDLDLIYFPGSYVSHKHQYEPLEYFGPCHGRLAGWPADPDLPLALLIGLGTEPRRADGVVEMLEPDILAVYMPVGDEPEYLDELRAENRRVLEVGGEPVLYPLRDTEQTYASLLATAAQLASRARVVMVPLGPKIFCAITIAVALSVGPEVGVWKASAGQRVEPVDVAAAGSPMHLRIRFTGPQ